MPHIQAFHGIRYDLGHVGSLSDVVAPPYDVIGPELQEDLYKKHPANVIRLILNRDEPGDADGDERYLRAAKYLKNWQREGLLQSEPRPAVYAYHQVFDYAGKSFTRRGFMARVRLEKFGEGNIYAHEETHSAAKADRLKLTTACRANLSQIFGIYPDETNEAQEILEAATVGQIPLEATDHLNVNHRIWPVTNVEQITKLIGVMGPKPVFIADGHHRYETACNYRDRLSADAPVGDEHPSNYVLMMCVSMNDPGMIVLPTHRLFRGLPPIDSDELVARLGNCFSTEAVGEGPEAAHSIWKRIESDNDQSKLGLFTAKDQQWTMATLTDSGRSRLAEIAGEHSEDWCGLGVSILHRLVVEDLLGSAELPKPTYVHLVSELVDGLKGDDEDEFSIASLVMPATLDHIRAISQHGERMPAKSTYFYPKLLSGLVLNPLE